jgi:hypothetical protein
MAPAATRRRLACRARRVRRERGRRAGGAWVRRTRNDGRAPRSCVRSARFVSSAIRVGIPEADWADLGAAAELTPSGARDARSGRRTSCPVDLAVQQSDDPLAGESSTRHGSAQRLATVPLRYESGRDGRRSRLGRRTEAPLRPDAWRPVHRHDGRGLRAPHRWELKDRRCRNEAHATARAIPHQLPESLVAIARGPASDCWSSSDAEARPIEARPTSRARRRF